MTDTKQQPTIRRPRLLMGIVLMAAALVALPATASAAHATGTVTATDSGASASYDWNTYTNHLTGTLYDRKASDQQCARVYDRGYNYFRGWGSWKLLKTVCAGGQGSYGEYITFYSDKVDLKVCTGYDACSIKRIWG